MIDIGKYNELRIVKKVPFGVYLEAEGYGELLLPTKYVPRGAEKGQVVRVFVYLDSEDRLIATTREPYVTTGEFAWLKIVSNSKFGAFADWGLEKDLFIPFREQRQKTIPGNYYLTYVYLDEHSGRIVGSHKYYKYLDDEIRNELEEGMEVEILLHEQTEIGYKAIINDSCSGMLYKNEIYESGIRSGSRVKAYIKKMREDGKIDLSLNKSGFGAVLDFSEQIIRQLKENDGFLALNDKSSPELIYDYFGVSKKVFKKAIGNLYRERKIAIVNDGIELV